jgi:drug/metabolite transporter (DMT)-like permease
MVAQKFTSPTHTALIYTGEPVFAGIFGYIFIHEVLGLKGIIGAFLILSGMLISEIDFKEILRKSFYKNKTKELSE